MRSAGIEERRRTGQVFERSHHAIEADGLRNRLRQAAGNPQKKVLRCFDDVAGDAMPQQIAIVNSANSEIFETVGIKVVDRAVKLSGIGADELGRYRGHESQLNARIS